MKFYLSLHYLCALRVSAVKNSTVMFFIKGVKKWQDQ